MERLRETDRFYRNRYDEIATEIERARLERNRVVCEAAAQGVSLREIGEVLNLSHQRVHQIVRGSD